ncbi:hypothetical protein QR680_010089 [Steinernema hermaphroditum]|uniref:Uncharacterized protein n=1 Tax=Steinernema hermaphroditum TaxID=289476 RepID=A0AA39IQ50_9BILA|nr:hypothetical protein QR680_010089 [Steinernema hermaphroditum]
MASYGIVVSQFLFLIVLWIGTATCCVLIFKRNTTRVFFKNSPTLFVIFAVLSCLAVNYMFFLIPWIIFISTGVGPEIGNAAIVFGIATICVQTIYDLFTIVLFIQRSAIIIAPLRSKRMLNRILYVLASLIAVFPFFYYSVLYARVIDFNLAPTSAGCFTMGCSEPLSQERSALDTGFFLASANVVVGAVFVTLLLRRKVPAGHNASKVNQVTRFLFFTRLFLEVIPLTFDIIFNLKTGMTISYYIGPFGMLGSSLEEFLFVVVYFVLFRPKIKAVQVSTTQ